VRQAIQWTDVTWNPVRGCSRVSPGCEHCYAERMAGRFTSRHGDAGPFQGFAEQRVGGPRWTGHVALIPEKLDEPLRWRKPRRVFVNSMSDLFHESLSWHDIARVFAVMLAAPCERHTFQILTKRAKRMREGMEKEIPKAIHTGCMLPSTSYCGSRWPPRNVWLGVSAEDQQRADERIPELLQSPAAVRFVSAEPLLGPLDLRPYLFRDSDPRHRCCPRCLYATNLPESACPNDGTPLGPDIAVDWLIVGGESGPGARPCDVAWIRSLVQQSREAGVPCFVKQLGSRPVMTGREYASWVAGPIECRHGYDVCPTCDREPVTLQLEDSKGGLVSEWPEDLRVRGFPA